MPIEFGSAVVCRSCKGKGIYSNNKGVCRACDGSGLTTPQETPISPAGERRLPPAGSLSVRQRAVLALLSDGMPHSGPEIASERVGGSEGLRRLRELRDMGFPVEGPFPIPGRDAFAYRLIL